MALGVIIAKSMRPAGVGIADIIEDGRNRLTPLAAPQTHTFDDEMAGVGAVPLCGLSRSSHGELTGAE